ncbi:MAG: hypothetical protein EBS19_11065 [Spirochaetia bacterium]|nr:hypothetical protein [Spirochaetia bacterium]
MKYLRIYEKFVGELEPQLGRGIPMEKTGNFETETTDFIPTKENEEGDYIVKFVNSEGEEVTATIGHAVDPEYMGKKMISSIEMVQDSSSDGKEYSFVGYYEEIPETAGAYGLKKVLIEG